VLTNEEAESVAAICLLAALADGSTDDAERGRLERVFSLLDGGSHSGVYQRVVMGKTDAAAEAARVRSPAARSMAYEMAVGVCEADGRTTPAERRFLDQLETALRIEHARAERTIEQGDQLAGADPLAVIDLDEPLAGEELQPAIIPMAPVPGEQRNTLRVGTAAGALSADAATPTQDPREAEIDAMVLKYAVLNGAIEFLPQDLATVAILPLQTKMVYRIGKRYGYALSAAHVKEFLGVIGLGMSSQIIEGYARKLFGKVAKQALGKTAGKLAQAATGPAMTFATTYALGRVAQQYYAGGRTLSAVDLRSLFQRSVSEGQRVYQQHEGAVRQRASGMGVSDVLNLVRGKQ